jgi:hypothetical protein
MTNKQRSGIARLAFKFVVTIGIVNLFADLTYEGARSITGPFLESLGASALAVGLIAGGGELFGYVLRSVAGYLADKTHRYWIVIFAGYVLNMFVVPALALAGNWPVAAALIVAERTGRGIRKPAVDALLSYAGKSIGRGWVFGLNEGLDQGRSYRWPINRCACTLLAWRFPCGCCPMSFQCPNEARDLAFSIPSLVWDGFLAAP